MEKLILILVIILLIGYFNWEHIQNEIWERMQSIFTFARDKVAFGNWESLWNIANMQKTKMKQSKWHSNRTSGVSLIQKISFNWIDFKLNLMYFCRYEGKQWRSKNVVTSMMVEQEISGKYYKLISCKLNIIFILFRFWSLFCDYLLHICSN